MPFFTLNEKVDCKEYSLTTSGRDLKGNPNSLRVWNDIAHSLNANGFITDATNLFNQLKPESVEANSGPETKVDTEG